ncbi:hypothetical protein HanHA300_Chr03g0100151 [Helianthus annuus]|nr:hypothetical protein HanHA300_Chr03g0100151 [Helianthus annuus]KAJ0768731.1 hypothetical protein HanLR1_Chr03g0105061 [Helianthus annuus]KAJ0774475.1 hypothetical protein HanOQP8_Chr03g0112531 [Helianthus annuus]
MASACLNTIGLSPENLPECSQKYSPYRWFTPRLSISRKMTEEDVSDLPEVSDPSPEISDLKNESDIKEFDGFEFRLEDPALMLPADELFSDGKLVPLQFPVKRPEVVTSTPYSRRIIDVDDPYYSPRAPRCSSRWKELLGFGKLHQSNSNTVKPTDNKRTTSLASSQSQNGSRSIRQLLYRNSKPSHDASINVPLLNNADNESASVSASGSVSVSSRLSISSSSSGHDIDDLPRLSLDSDKPAKLNNMNVNPNPNPNTRTKTRLAKTTTQTKSRSTDNTLTTTRVGRTTRRRSMEATNRCLSVDSPRINSSGKIVFHSLERSSSSPSSLIGGPRFKHRGMERSYSGNVRITPVLNVPVCSLSKSGGVFGFQIFSSQQKQVCSSSNNGGSIRSQRVNSKSNRILE